MNDGRYSKRVRQMEAEGEGVRQRHAGIETPRMAVMKSTVYSRSMEGRRS